MLGRKTTIGRTPDNDLQIDVKYISRHHAVILVGPAHAIIEDLNSTNGVMVNGRRVTRQILRDGDQVAIARAEYRFALRRTARSADNGIPRSLSFAFAVASPYIEKILKARVYDVAIESPLEEAARLSRRLGNDVLLKREDLQPVFSFKLRGAYNRIATSARRRPEAGWCAPRPATTRRAWRSPRAAAGSRRSSSCPRRRRSSRYRR